MALNYDVIFRLAMRKAKTHKGRRYAFGGLITELCRNLNVPEEEEDYIPIIHAPLPMLLLMVRGSMCLWDQY